MDPLSIIASTISVIQAISSTYKAIQHLRGLPHEFNEVARNLPLARDTLGLAHDHLQGLALGEPSKSALQPVISRCEEKAKMLQNIFDKVEEGTRNAKGGSVLDFYRTSLLRLGKAHRVESLMGDILKGVDALSTNRLFATATQSQMAQLKDAIDELSHVRSSVSDLEFESPGSNIMNNNDQATGDMAVITGQSHNINPGSGKFFNAQNMTFVESYENMSRSNILQALHTSPYRDRKDRNPDRAPGTCEWFVGHDYFRQWRESKSSSILWVSANPGCGKSVLAKHLVDSELPTTKSKTTCYFFFKDDFEDQRTATTALNCILHQIFVQREILLSDKIIKRFKDHETHITSSFSELWELLMMISRDDNAGEILCILDAFDECEDQQRDVFVQALRKFYGTEIDTKHNVNLKFLITSRPYDKIRLNFQPVIHLEGESEAEILNIAREVDTYIDHRVSRVRESLLLTQDETTLLLRELRRVPNQTYLWVYLTLDLVEKDINIDPSKIREVTSSLPHTVDEAYERILSRCRNPMEARKPLQIVVAAARPLTLAEMDIALALRESHKSYRDLEPMPEARFRKYVTDLCGLFITITNSKIYLLHQTAKEFLVPNYQSGSEGSYNERLTWKRSLQPTESHHVLVKICIQLLLLIKSKTYDHHKNLDYYREGSRYLRDHLLLEYSATNWALHFRESNMKDDAITKSVLQLVDERLDRSSGWFRIYWARAHGDFPRGFTMLMVAAYFGLEQIVKLHLGTGDVDLNSIDLTHGRSALSWASENGFDNVVKLLIKGPRFRWKNIFRLSHLKAAKVDADDKNGRTPLSYAAWNGRMAVVDRLVKAGARVDSMDFTGGTPISYALISGHDAVAERLIEGAQVRSVDKISRELLFSAARTGDTTVVERLLEIGADMDMVEYTGRTPLSLAAEHGHTRIVRLLVDKGADVNKKYTEDSTPLGYAIWNRDIDMIKILLKKGAIVDHTFVLRVREPDALQALQALQGLHRPPTSTPLKPRADIAALADRVLMKEDVSMVQLLLDHGARPDFCSRSSNTPLELAQQPGYCDRTITQKLEERQLELFGTD